MEYKINDLLGLVEFPYPKAWDYEYPRVDIDELIIEYQDRWINEFLLEFKFNLEYLVNSEYATRTLTPDTKMDLGRDIVTLIDWMYETYPQFKKLRIKIGNKLLNLSEDTEDLDLNELVYASDEDIYNSKFNVDTKLLARYFAYNK